MSDVVAAIEPPVPASTSPIAACAEAQDDLDSRVATLRAAASFYRTLEERQRQRARLMLPTMGCLIAGLVVLLSVTVLSTFDSMFRDFGLQPPLLTKAVLAMGRFVQSTGSRCWSSWC